MAVLPADAVLEANRRYHDVAAGEYDAKWGVSYGPIGRRQVLGKVEKLLGRAPGPFARSLEVGAGTGYFTLNLLAAGVVRSAVATDLSPGMLATLEANAAELGLDVETRACDAATLPFPDAAFDLVLGHAVLHHLVDLEACLREFRRVLRPGGTILFAGEPSRYGDRLAALPKRAAGTAAPAWRRLFGVRTAKGSELAIEHAPGGSSGARNGHTPERDRLEVADDHALEPLVDVHAFAPADLERHARAAGFEGVVVRGEELLANQFGWFNRSLEATGEPDSIPWAWTQYAYRGYLALQAVDRVLLEPRLPAACFYNLMLTGRRPSLTRGDPPPG